MEHVPRMVRVPHPLSLAKGIVSMTDKLQTTLKPSFMGTRSEAEEKFLAAVDRWHELRRPLMAPAAEHRRRDAAEHEARFQLANAASLLAWHMRNANA